MTDFSNTLYRSLSDLGDTFAQNRMANARRELPTGPDGSIDYAAAAKRLLAAGDIQGATTLAQLGQQAWQRQFQERLHSPEYITQTETAKARVAQQFAPKTTNIKTPDGDEVTVVMGPNGLTVPQVSGMPSPAATGIGGLTPPPGVNVKAWKEARSKQLANIDDKGVLEADKAADAGVAVQGSLKDAIKLNETAFSGPFAKERGYLTSQIGPGGGEDTEKLNNLIITQALEQLKLTFGGMPTEGERKILIEVQGSVNKAPGVRKDIYERAMKSAAEKTEQNRKRAEEMRSGQFLLPQSQRTGGGLPPGVTAQQAIAEAREDIAKYPAIRDAVIERLKGWGITGPGL